MEMFKGQKMRHDPRFDLLERLFERSLEAQPGTTG